MTNPPSDGLSGLMQVAMPVQNVDRAVVFYRDTLGIPFLFRAGDLAFFDLAGVRLLLERPATEEFDHPGSILYFRVPDVRPKYEELRAQGVEFIGEPHVVNSTPVNELWMAFFRDGEGNVLALAAEIPLA